jgi:hypothetical protein
MCGRDLARARQRLTVCDANVLAYLIDGTEPGRRTPARAAPGAAQ